MDYTEKTLRRVNTFHGIIVDVQTDMIELPNGAVTMREVVRHPGGVCVAAVDEAGVITLVRQYRYPFGAHLLELPAAKRELSEETGLEAESWVPLGALYTSPGFSTEKLYIYLATELRQGRAHPDPNEFLDVVRMPLAELTDRIEAGEICDAKTVVGALRAERRLRGI